MNDYQKLKSYAEKQKETRAILTDIKTEKIFDGDADASYLEQSEFEERLQEYEAGNFYFIGIQAKATLHIPHKASNGNVTHFRVLEIDSSGLWGIESDSSEDYLKSVEYEEINNVKDICKILNVDFVYYDWGVFD